MNTERTSLEQQLHDTSTRMIMHTIKWMNDTFVPMGMKPLEDLPVGDIGDSRSCVLANALQANMPSDFHGVNVVPTYIEFYNPDGRFICQDTDQDVQDFIEAFDNREFPDLMSDWSKEDYESQDCDCGECGDDGEQQITDVECINCGATMGACVVEEYEHTLCATCIKAGYDLNTCVKELVSINVEGEV